MILFQRYCEKRYKALLKRADEGSVWARLILFPSLILSYIYWAAFCCIRSIKQAQRKSFPYFSITVGNIVMGGTGKTPCISAILEAIGASKTLYVARGYGKKISQFRILSHEDVSYEKVGDEAALLSNRFSELSFCMSGKLGKRYVMEQIAKTSDYRWVIVDDALQHDEIAFDLSIVTMDVLNPYGFHALLPRGLLREWPDERFRSGTVDYIVLTNCRDIERAQAVQQEIEARWQIPVIATKTVLDDLIGVDGLSYSIPEDAAICLITGVASPDRVKDLLVQYFPSNPILDHLALSDHAEMSYDMIEKWIDGFYKERRRERFIVVTTEKDFVRRSDWQKLKVAVCYMKIELEVILGIDRWQGLLETIRKGIQDRK